jgi:hypothetical protein
VAWIRRDLRHAPACHGPSAALFGDMQAGPVLGSKLLVLGSNFFILRARMEVSAGE